MDFATFSSLPVRARTGCRESYAVHPADNLPSTIATRADACYRLQLDEAAIRSCPLRLSEHLTLPTYTHGRHRRSICAFQQHPRTQEQSHAHGRIDLAISLSLHKSLGQFVQKMEGFHRSRQALFFTCQPQGGQSRWASQGLCSSTKRALSHVSELSNTSQRACCLWPIDAR